MWEWGLRGLGKQIYRTSRKAAVEGTESSFIRQPSV